MRRFGVLAVIAAALALTAGRAAAATITVTIGPGGTTTFSPANATIHVGDGVHWVWAGSFHSSTSGSPPGTPDHRWDSGVQNAGFTFDHTFTATGTFHYY